MKNIFKVFTFILILFCFTRCDDGTNDETTPSESSTEEFVSFSEIAFPDVMYYGANLGYFPPKARDWIMNTQFTKENMEKPSMIDSSLKVWWSEDNNKILMEASYIIAQGYVGAGTIKTWGQDAYYSGSSKIFDTYGKYAKYQTLRFKYEYRLDVDRQLKSDSVYVEIINFAKQLCSEIEYDWANFDGYKGSVNPTPGLKHVVCDGYANEVMERVLQLSSVMSVQKWTSPGHAWNVLKLSDGRTLYFDLTWFDNEYINSETGEIYETEDYKWENITFYDHLFRFSNIGYGTKIFHHNEGKFNSEKIR
jgi:hypothetical protein